MDEDEESGGGIYLLKNKKSVPMKTNKTTSALNPG